MQQITRSSRFFVVFAELGLHVAGVVARMLRIVHRKDQSQTRTIQLYTGVVINVYSK
jgi:hypothetical protein